jgi:glyoxylase-like metal-dependent hydrolase (beta-lactamase superfamily II)
MKLTDKIHLLQIDFEVAITPEKKIARFVNVIIIFGDNITLIDTGVKGSEEQIFAYIKQCNRNISDIKTIILSHSHPDHIGSANRIKDLTKCEVLSHGNEVDWMENIDIQNKLRPVPGFYNLVDHSVKVDRRLQSGQELKVAEDVTLKIVHAPGHSKGSLNIIFKEDHILFTADSIPLKNDIPNYDNYPELMRSLKTIKENTQYKTLLTSWTPPLTNLTEIKKLLSDGEEYMIKIDQLVKEIYIGNELGPFIFCRKTIEKLGLPPFLVTPIVDQAFRGHLKV